MFNRSSLTFGLTGVALIATVGFVMPLSSEVAPKTGEAPKVVVVKAPVREATNIPFRTVFAEEGLKKDWWVADFAIQRPSFWTKWSKGNVKVDDTGLKLSFGPAPKPVQEETGKKFISGQVQRVGWFSYGRYEVVMRPAKGHGLISSFFTYTGPHFKDNHDEIDIEFLGKDTSQLHLTRFDDGKRLEAPYKIDLGVDAFEKARLYGFEWHPDRIIWFVGDRVVAEVTSDQASIPASPGKIHFDLWGGAKGQRNWSGTVPDDMMGTSQYLCVSYVRLDLVGQQCSDKF